MGDMFPIQGGPAIPWEMIAPHERQAKTNHDQSLTRLAERGGLSPCEALAVLDDRRWKRMDDSEAKAALTLRVADWTASHSIQAKTIADLQAKLAAAEARVAELAKELDDTRDDAKSWSRAWVDSNAKLALAITALRRIYTGRHALNAVEMSCIAAEGLEGAGGAGEPSVTGTIARTADDGERRGNIHPKGKP